MIYGWVIYTACFIRIAFQLYIEDKFVSLYMKFVYYSIFKRIYPF